MCACERETDITARAHKGKWGCLQKPFFGGAQFSVAAAATAPTFGTKEPQMRRLPRPSPDHQERNATKLLLARLLERRKVINNANDLDSDIARCIDLHCWGCTGGPWTLCHSPKSRSDLSVGQMQQYDDLLEWLLRWRKRIQFDVPCNDPQETMLVISGPAGSGKNTLLSLALQTAKMNKEAWTPEYVNDVVSQVCESPHHGDGFSVLREHLCPPVRSAAFDFLGTGSNATQSEYYICALSDPEVMCMAASTTAAAEAVTHDDSAARRAAVAHSNRFMQICKDPRGVRRPLLILLRTPTGTARVRSTGPVFLRPDKTGPAAAAAAKPKKATAPPPAKRTKRSVAVAAADDDEDGGGGGNSKKGPATPINATLVWLKRMQSGGARHIKVPAWPIDTPAAAGEGGAKNGPLTSLLDLGTAMLRREGVELLFKYLLNPRGCSLFPGQANASKAQTVAAQIEKQMAAIARQSEGNAQQFLKVVQYEMDLPGRIRQDSATPPMIKGDDKAVRRAEVQTQLSEAYGPSSGSVVQHVLFACAPRLRAAYRTAMNSVWSDDDGINNNESPEGGNNNNKKKATKKATARLREAPPLAVRLHQMLEAVRGAAAVGMLAMSQVNGGDPTASQAVVVPAATILSCHYALQAMLDPGSTTGAKGRRLKANISPKDAAELQSWTSQRMDIWRGVLQGAGGAAQAMSDAVRRKRRHASMTRLVETIPLRYGGTQGRAVGACVLNPVYGDPTLEAREDEGGDDSDVYSSGSASQAPIKRKHLRVRRNNWSSRSLALSTHATNLFHLAASTHGEASDEMLRSAAPPPVVNEMSLTCDEFARRAFVPAVRLVEPASGSVALDSGPPTVTAQHRRMLTLRWNVDDADVKEAVLCSFTYAPTTAAAKKPANRQKKQKVDASPPPPSVTTIPPPRRKWQRKPK